MNRETIHRLGSPFCGVFIASVLLGLAYNSASPLGVRPSNSGAKLAATPARAIPSTGYFNETVSLALEGAGPPVPAGNGASAPGAGSIPTLTWPEVKASMASGQIVLIDARVSSYYQAEHIPGAISLPANSPPAEVAAFATKNPKNAPLIIYCGSLTCPMAHQLADVLIGQYGFSNVKIMPGGFAEYRIAQTADSTGEGR